jgi:hypothetical protein
MKNIFFETKLLYETPNFNTLKTAMSSASSHKDAPSNNPNDRPSRSRERQRTAESPSQELNRQERRLFQLLNNIKRPIEDISDENIKQEIQIIIEDFEKAINEKDYELAKNYLELIEDLLATSPEDIKSYSRAKEKINHAKDIGIFESTGIQILTREDDSSIPERQFKIQELDSNIFPGGIYTSTSELNEHLFTKGLSEENLQNTYLKIAEKEITKLLERSENNLPEEDKELLIACMDSNHLDTPGIKFKHTESEKLDELLEVEMENLITEYYETARARIIEIDEEEYASGKYTEIPYQMFPVHVESAKNNKTETTNTEDITEASKEIRIKKHSEEIPEELKLRLKAELTEKYKDLPLNIRSETINQKLNQILLYYKRTLAKKHIEIRLGKLPQGIVIY